MNEVDKLAENISRKVTGAKQSQLRFAICEEVDWENKTMTAVGVSDDVPYYGVQLGFGYCDIQPAIGTICLIGILEGKEAYTFLINAEKVDLVEINAKKIVANCGENSGLVKIAELTRKMNVLENDLNTLKNAFNSWIPITQDGGSALKTAISGWSGSQIEVTKQSDVENDKITH